MPKDKHFSFSVLVGDERVAEHVVDGSTFIEADIFGPHSRLEERCEVVDGQEERQAFSVLPYKVSVHLFSSFKRPAWAFVTVDGFSAAKIWVRPGGTITVEGFKDGDNIREFLFSMPRFGNDKDDKIEEERHSSVGVIEVVIKEAVFLRSEERHSDHKSKSKSLKYTQATKKDSQIITNGEYLMATTKPGRCIDPPKKAEYGKGGYYKVDLFSEGRIFGSLKVKYRIKSNVNSQMVIPVVVLSDEEEAKCAPTCENSLRVLRSANLR